MNDNGLVDLPIDPNVVKISAQQTIGSIIDGLVELITNSDDGYLRIERGGGQGSGLINIEVIKKDNKKCESIRVWDEASGMTAEELLLALKFAGEQSAESRKSVRGLFGKGMKEAILGLGIGRILSTKNEVAVQTRVLIDQGTPRYDKSLLSKEMKSDDPDGTDVHVKIGSDVGRKANIPKHKTFSEHLTKHYALRDIMSNKNRDIRLTFSEGTTTHRDQKLQYNFPEAKMVIAKETVPVTDNNEDIFLELYESDTLLSWNRSNPHSEAGILICTGKAILENVLLKFENEEAAKYFYGKANCPGIEERLLSDIEEEKNEAIGMILQNRKGLDWTKPYPASIKKTIENRIEQIISNKAAQLQQESKSEVDSSSKKSLNKLCTIMNKLAKVYLLDEVSPPTNEVTNLMIRPTVINVEIDTERAVSIYAPQKLGINSNEIATIKVTHEEISTDCESVKLSMHDKGYYYGTFKVQGCSREAECSVIIEMGDEKTLGTIRVLKELPRGGRPRPLRPRKGGFITDIVPDISPSPYERVSYDASLGVISIYINFPSTKTILDESLSMESKEEKVLVSELACEAFSAALATTGLESGKYVLFPGNEIESYITAVNEIRRDFQRQLQDVLVQ